eukprot:408040_1
MSVNILYVLITILLATLLTFYIYCWPQKFKMTKHAIEWVNLETELEKFRSIQNKSGTIKIQKNEHSDENAMDERKKQHEYFDPTKAINELGCGTGFGGACVYTVDLGIDLAAGLWFGSAAFEAGMLLASGGVVAAAGGALWGAHSAYTYFCNCAEQNKFNQKRNHNFKVKLFNTKLAKLKIIQQKLLEKQNELKAQEKK